MGLISVPCRQFNGHTVHAVDKYRKDEAKLKGQVKLLQCKLVQMQLTDLQSKGKTQTQAAEMSEVIQQQLQTHAATNMTQQQDIDMSTPPMAGSCIHQRVCTTARQIAKVSILDSSREAKEAHHTGQTLQHAGDVVT